MSDGFVGAAALGGSCCLMCIVCAISALSIPYIVFGIIFLVQAKDVCSHYSPLWVYGVVTLVIPCGTACCGQILPALCGKVNPFLGGLLYTATIFIYGFIVLYGDYLCEDMINNKLYTWSMVTLYYNLALFVILLPLTCIACCAPQQQQSIDE